MDIPLPTEGTEAASVSQENTADRLSWHESWWTFFWTVLTVTLLATILFLTYQYGKAVYANGTVLP